MHLGLNICNNLCRAFFKQCF